MLECFMLSMIKYIPISDRDVRRNIMVEAAIDMMCTDAYTITCLGYFLGYLHLAPMYIYPGCSSNLATWMDDRRPTPPIMLFKGHAGFPNTARPRMKSNARNMTTKEDINLHGVQNFFFLSGMLTPPPPEGISNTVMPLLGGRRKVPPAPRCLLRRRRSPCSNFGGRLACNELIIAEYCRGQYLGLFVMYDDF